ncbi:hypothetical protein LPJ62_003801 [Coemansia sp. RSA 2167]|nr:hypothetical protein LPJ62_003801 [Coemansia sp. RSA 2167]KAJ2142290.1 hypothetical protein IW142_004385 [Coemansia sp. RSA 564]KAJ2155469.1 hypothetical protein J3F82_000434 [Coemansia sp. RSA 637]KAJ2169040.1 hypothetical protein GGH15_000890 [Coemansia sp. RSA 562]KAJ2425865.1 hypothetical protein GGF47_002372 [Coemansia sp. RSA 2524]
MCITLAFATESFYMLDSIRNVFRNLHVNAERWIDAPKDVEPVDVPMYREPVATTSACAESGVALVEIGEQMRHMDVRLSFHNSFADDDASCKRNRTREPTPMHM